MLQIVRKILSIGRARYIALPKGLFPDTEKLLLEIESLDTDGTVIMKLRPYRKAST